jgi:hypothetical protein
VTHLPRREELFNTVTGYTNARAAARTSTAVATGASAAAIGEVNPPADLKTVHYYVRQGEMIAPGSAAATSLSPDAQASAGGLVRQETSRRERVFAEQTGAGGVLGSGAVLVAPEVAQIQFRYYDGSQLTESWDMKLLNKLPIAIEVCIWMMPTRAAPDVTDLSAANQLQSSRAYRQIVHLPMSQVAQSSAASAMESSMSSSTDAASETTGSSTSAAAGSGSAFGEQ